MINLTNVKTTEQESIPAGRYTACITGATVKETKTGGTMITTEFTLTTDGFKGRKIWENYNIKNDNQKAVEIGLSQLKTLCLAIGYKAEQLGNFDPEMLLNKDLTIETKIETDATYGDKPRIKKYLTTTVNQFATPSDANVPF